MKILLPFVILVLVHHFLLVPLIRKKLPLYIGLMEQLPPSRFMRIHRSYIIALEHIAEASHSSVLLDNGKTLPVGEVYRPAFAEYLASC